MRSRIEINAAHDLVKLPRKMHPLLILRKIIHGLVQLAHLMGLRGLDLLRLQGTPGMHDGTKNRLFTNHGTEWAAVVQKLKDELTTLQTDINSLAILK